MTWTNNYIGLPYKPKGRDRSGVDCWGLHRLIKQEVKGVLLPDFTQSYLDPDDSDSVARLVLAEARKNWMPVQHGEELPFDVIVLRLKSSPMHIGTVVRPGVMIHVLDGTCAVLEEYNTGTWCHRITGFHRSI